MLEFQAQPIKKRPSFAVVLKIIYPVHRGETKIYMDGGGGGVGTSGVFVLTGSGVFSCCGAEVSVGERVRVGREVGAWVRDAVSVAVRVAVGRITPVLVG